MDAKLAERAGFEPALGYYPKHAFQACDLNRSSTSPGWLLDFGFFVRNMLAGNRIKLLDFHFSRHGLFIFGGGVEVPGSCRGLQFDFIAHRDSPDD